MNTELTVQNQEMITIEVTEEQLAELHKIAQDTASKFANIDDNGLKFQERILTGCAVVITHWDRIRYRWKDGKVKEIAPADMSDAEARKQGYKPGTDLQLVFQAPSELFGIEANLSLPISSHLNFSAYVTHLENNKATPASVITRIGTTQKQFKKGGRTTVLTFTPISLINGAEVPAGNAEAHFFEEDPEDAWGE